MVLAIGLSHEDIVEANVVEMFESHGNHAQSEKLMQPEQGNVEEWWEFIATAHTEL